MVWYVYIHMERLRTAGLGAEGTGRFQAEVVWRVQLRLIAGEGKLLFGRRRDRHVVIKAGNRQEDGLQIMVAVWPRTKHF